MADAVAIFTPGQRLISASGVPYANCTISFYNAGSDDPKEVFSDANLQNTLGSIVYTDSAGYPVTASGGSTKTQVYTGTGAYKIVIADSGTGETTTHDDCVGAVISGAGGGGASGITQAEADLRYIRNANALSAITDLADADIFPLWKISGSGNRGITYAGLKTELTTDFRADGRLFSSGVATIFYQATAPTGWTKNATAALNDAAIRTVTDTNGGSTGGSAGVTTAFASRTITQANLPSVTWSDTLSATTGITNGTLVHRAGTGTGLGGGGGSGYIDIIQATLTASTTVNGSVTSGGSGEALSFAVKYANMIHCTKD